MWVTVRYSTMCRKSICHCWTHIAQIYLSEISQIYNFLNLLHLRQSACHSTDTKRFIYNWNTINFKYIVKNTGVVICYL